MHSIDWLSDLIDWLVHFVNYLSVCPLKTLLIHGSLLLISSRGQNGLAYCNNWTLKTCVEFYILFLTHALLSKQSLSVLAVVAAPSRSSAFTECPVHIFSFSSRMLLLIQTAKAEAQNQHQLPHTAKRKGRVSRGRLFTLHWSCWRLLLPLFRRTAPANILLLSQPSSGRRWFFHLMVFFGVHWTCECGIIAAIVEEANLSSDWSIDWLIWLIWSIDRLVDWLIAFECSSGFWALPVCS